MDRDSLVAFLNQYLEIDRLRDHAPNGLQVIGKPEVRRVALAVSVSAEAFRAAAAGSADLLLVHHGLFWDGDSRVVGAHLRDRLRVLFDHDITLLSYHLPLDRHLEVGNNAQIIKQLGLRLVESERPLAEVGYVGEAEAPLAAADLVERVNRLFTAASFVERAGKDRVQRVGVVSGGAGRTAYLLEAAARACDFYLTGVLSEAAPALARELGLGVVAAGHYNSEKLGVLALGQLLRDRFGLTTFFVDVPNPL